MNETEREKAVRAFYAKFPDVGDWYETHVVVADYNVRDCDITWAIEQLTPFAGSTRAGWGVDIAVDDVLAFLQGLL